MVLLCKIISKTSALKSSWSGNGIYKHRKERNHLVYKFASWSFSWIFLKTWLLYYPAFVWIISVNELDFHHREGNQGEVGKCCRKNLNPGFSVLFSSVVLPPQERIVLLAFAHLHSDVSLACLTFIKYCYTSLMISKWHISHKKR